MNIFLSKQDYYRVVSKSLLALYDFETITSLYQPIIGASAAMLYFTLVSEIKMQEWIDVSTHDVLLKKTGFNLHEIENARKKLEGIALLKSYRKESSTSVSYIYEIYAPKTPQEFLNDACYRGLLIEALGDKEVSRLIRIYSLKEEDLKDYAAISASFKNVYDINSVSFIPKGEQVKGVTRLDVKVDFDYKVLNNILFEKYQIPLKALNNDELKEIERLALLFGLNESQIAYFVMNASDKTNSYRLDKDKLFYDLKSSVLLPIYHDSNNEQPKEYSEDTMFAKKVNLMNQTSPFEYFKIQSGMSNPSPADIAILNDLSRSYDLNNGVINAIVDYTLSVCDNQFPRPYCEKLAATLKRKKVKNAMEAINALTNKKTKKVTPVKEEIKEVLSEEETVDLEELRNRMERL